MKTYLIYKHTSPDGKAFIGITSQGESIIYRKPSQTYRALYDAAKKYDWDSFTHEIFMHDLNITKEHKHLKVI